jgi:hypothetical protein
MKDDSVAKVIEEIGTGPACFTQGNIDELIEALLKGGYTAGQGCAVCWNRCLHRPTSRDADNAQA